MLKLTQPNLSTYIISPPLQENSKNSVRYHKPSSTNMSFVLINLDKLSDQFNPYELYSPLQDKPSDCACWIQQ